MSTATPTSGGAGRIGHLRARARASILWHLAHWRFIGDLVHAAPIHSPFIYGGPPSRVDLGEGVVLNDAILNVSSGRIVIGAWSFCGHGVSFLTGTHDIARRLADRQRAVPPTGRDIVIGEGVWLASGVTVLGPCSIGEHAVVAAGAVVTGDVPAGMIMGGVPARPLREIPAESV